MADIKEKPWTSGPKELLDHAETHLKGSSAFDHRIAFVSIDNAVELIIRTFLSLPKRARGREGPPRKAMDAAFGFPDLLDLLEEYADDLIQGIELGDIEWFHRIRNSLYHDGNGITVDIEQLRNYRVVAHILFQNLFGISLSAPTKSPLSVTDAFLHNWIELENRLKTAAMQFITKPHHRPPQHLVQILRENSIVDEKFEQDFTALRNTRNEIVHGGALGGMDAGHVMQALVSLVNKLPPWQRTPES